MSAATITAENVKTVLGLRAGLVTTHGQSQQLRTEIRQRSQFEKPDKEPSRQVPFQMYMVLSSRIRNGGMYDVSVPHPWQLKTASSFAGEPPLCNTGVQSPPTCISRK